MCDCSKNNGFDLKRFHLPCHEINIEIILRKHTFDDIFNREVREFCVILNERQTCFAIHLDDEMFHQLIISLREWNTLNIPLKTFEPISNKIRIDFIPFFEKIMINFDTNIIFVDAITVSSLVLFYESLKNVMNIDWADIDLYFQEIEL